MTQNPLIHLEFGYGLTSPLGKLQERFGSLLNPHLSLAFQPKSSSWLIKTEGHYFFGNKVKTDVLQNLRTKEGYIIGNDMSIADIQLRARGYYLGLAFEKTNIFDRFSAGIGTGFLLHRIRIQKDPASFVPQLEGDYSNGYDRLTSGLGVSSFLGYRYLSSNRRINFSLSIFGIAGFTELQRDYQFDLKGLPDNNPVDFLTGVKISWILPFYFDDPDLIFY